MIIEIKLEREEYDDFKEHLSKKYIISKEEINNSVLRGEWDARLMIESKDGRDRCEKCNSEKMLVKTSEGLYCFACLSTLDLADQYKDTLLKGIK